MDRLDKSLDDLIKSKPTNKKFGSNKGGVVKQGGKFSGKVRSNQSKEIRKPEPYFNSNTVIKQPFQQQFQQPAQQQLRQPQFSFNAAPAPVQSQFAASASIFDRIGTGGSAGATHISGTSVTISNLNQDISLSDLSELCATLGEVKSVEFIAPIATATHKKVAKVLFARRSDALNCVKKFHGLTLDGTPMEIKLSGENGKENPFNPFHDISPVLGHPNVRAGLFGTALQEFEEVPGAHQDHAVVFQPHSHFQASSSPTYQVTLSDPYTGGGGGGRSNNNFGGRSGSFRTQGGNNSSRGSGSGSGSRPRSAAGGSRGKKPSGMDTDAAFDSYLSQRNG